MRQKTPSKKADKHDLMLFSEIIRYSRFTVNAAASAGDTVTAAGVTTFIHLI